MKIKGHTIIELTDVNTGAKERYEKDNMVTHALDKYFEDIGAFNISPLYNSDVRNNLIPRLLGGLLLGVIETFAKAYISTQLSDAVVFSVLIIVLLVRPAGLLGKTINEKV